MFITYFCSVTLPFLSKHSASNKLTLAKWPTILWASVTCSFSPSVHSLLETCIQHCHLKRRDKWLICFYDLKYFQQTFFLNFLQPVDRRRPTTSGGAGRATNGRRTLWAVQHFIYCIIRIILNHTDRVNKLTVWRLTFTFKWMFNLCPTSPKKVIFISFSALDIWNIKIKNLMEPKIENTRLIRHSSRSSLHQNNEMNWKLISLVITCVLLRVWCLFWPMNWKFMCSKHWV